MGTSVQFFISPHLDDAVLSCGGYIFHLASVGKRVIVATAATADGPPGAPLSWLARRNHRAWRLGDAPFSARRDEDAAAVESLGASYLHLGLIDAVYRCGADGLPLYNGNRMRVPVHPHDWQYFEPALRERLHQELRSREGRGVRVFCPLGAGGHVDHLIVRRSVESLCDPEAVTYYEDYPYSVWPGAVAASTGRGEEDRGWCSSIVRLSDEEIDARIAAVARYRSQLPGLFPSEAERWLEIIRARLSVIPPFLDRWPGSLTLGTRMASALREYIRLVSGERYWCLCRERMR